jgi:hypothetical protein
MIDGFHQYSSSLPSGFRIATDTDQNEWLISIYLMRPTNLILVHIGGLVNAIQLYLKLYSKLFNFYFLFFHVGTVDTNSSMQSIY